MKKFCRCNCHFLGELVFVWVLFVIRIFCADIFRCLIKPYLRMWKSGFDIILNTYHFYSYFVPFEVSLSVVCVMLFVTKTKRCFQPGVPKSFGSCLLVLLPLLLSSIYSLKWMLIDYPNIVDKQYRIFGNQNKVDAENYHRLWPFRNGLNSEENSGKRLLFSDTEDTTGDVLGHRDK